MGVLDVYTKEQIVGCTWVYVTFLSVLLVHPDVLISSFEAVSGK